MAPFLIGAVIGSLIGVIAILAYHLRKARTEVECRDRHLAWVDERDVLLTALFARVSEARLIPMTNPLDGMKQFGMITKNAVDNAATYLTEMDERLTHAQGFLKRAIAAAKEVEVWEARNPAPPVRPGEKRDADVSRPMPMRRPEYGTAAVDAAVARLEEKAEIKSLGKGVFGPEQEDEDDDG